MAACSGSTAGAADKNKEEAPVPLVRATAAVLRQVRREIRTTGFLESEQTSTVVSLVSGRLSAIYVDEGTLVTSGQLLASVDDREAKSAIQQLTVQRDGKELDQQLAALEVEAADRRIAQASIEVQPLQTWFATSFCSMTPRAPGPTWIPFCEPRSRSVGPGSRLLNSHSAGLLISYCTTHSTWAALRSPVTMSLSRVCSLDT